MNIHQLRQLAKQEEIDYQFLMFALRHYANPRDKIKRWLKDNGLIRVKKGLYIFGEQAAQRPYSLELLANLIYGPSMISSSYALFLYGVLTERVSLISSITPKKSKSFSTPVGHFEYQYLRSEKYALGMQQKTTLSGEHYLMASPEKAFSDWITLDLKPQMWHVPQDILPFLFDDLRLNEVPFMEMDWILLKQLAELYDNSALTQLVTALTTYFGGANA